MRSVGELFQRTCPEKGGWQCPRSPASLEKRLTPDHTSPFSEPISSLFTVVKAIPTQPMFTAGRGALWHTDVTLSFPPLAPHYHPALSGHLGLPTFDPVPVHSKAWSPHPPGFCFAGFTMGCRG